MTTRDLHSYFTSQKNNKNKSQPGIPELVIATRNVTTAGVSAVNAELESFNKKKGRKGSSCNIRMPSRVKEEVGKYTYSKGIQAAINSFKSKYPQYIFLQTCMKNWKYIFNNQKKDLLPPIVNKHERPNLVINDLLQKIKEAIIEARLSGAVISRKMVVSVSNGVLKANDLNTLSEFGGNITLTDDRGRGNLQSMDWVKHKGTNGGIEPCPPPSPLPPLTPS